VHVPEHLVRRLKKWLAKETDIDIKVACKNTE
jgi:hypothetical protein